MVRASESVIPDADHGARHSEACWLDGHGSAYRTKILQAHRRCPGTARRCPGTARRLRASGAYGCKVGRSDVPVQRAARAPAARSETHSHLISPQHTRIRATRRDGRVESRACRRKIAGRGARKRRPADPVGPGRGAGVAWSQEQEASASCARPGRAFRVGCCARARAASCWQNCCRVAPPAARR